MVVEIYIADDIKLRVDGSYASAEKCWARRADDAIPDVPSEFSYIDKYCKIVVIVGSHEHTFSAPMGFADLWDADLHDAADELWGADNSQQSF